MTLYSCAISKVKDWREERKATFMFIPLRCLKTNVEKVILTENKGVAYNVQCIYYPDGGDINLIIQTMSRKLFFSPFCPLEGNVFLFYISKFYFHLILFDFIWYLASFASHRSTSSNLPTLKMGKYQYLTEHFIVSFSKVVIPFAFQTYPYSSEKGIVIV